MGRSYLVRSLDVQQGVGSVVTARAGDVSIGAATGIALGGAVSAAGTVQLTAASGDIKEATVGGASGTGRVAARTAAYV